MISMEIYNKLSEKAQWYIDTSDQEGIKLYEGLTADEIENLVAEME